jgi:hypothetical protein
VLKFGGNVYDTKTETANPWLLAKNKARLYISVA